MKKSAVIVFCTLFLAFTPQSQAQTKAQKYIDQLKTSEELRQAAWGVSARTLDGRAVAEYNPDLRLLPASNTKLLSTGLALRELGGDYRFRTTVAYSGSIENGVLKGDLYIVGGGDPTIGARDSIAYPLLTTFCAWEKIIRDAGITRIDGHVIGDGRYYDGEAEHLSWQYEDLGTDYGAGPGALSFYENIQEFEIVPGTAAGDSLKVRTAFPETPWMTLRVNALSGAEGSDNTLVYVNTDLAPVGEIRGSLAAKRRAYRMAGSNRFGALTCAYYFFRYLEAGGIRVSEGPADIESGGRLRNFSDEALTANAVPSNKLRSLGESLSPTLEEIAKKTNYESDNFYAETLLRALAIKRTGSSCYDSCAVAESAALRALGLKPESVQIVDGSGLSRKNYICPSFFTDYLAAVRSDEFIGTLPGPGRGTMVSRLRTAPDSVRSRVFMKSGSMGGVRGFSGYILPADPSKADTDTIVFSIIANNTIVDVSRINFLMDKIITLLAEENQ